MESLANTPKKDSQFNVQQFLMASLIMSLPLKAHTNKPFQVDRVTVGAASLTYSRGNLKQSLGEKIVSPLFTVYIKIYDIK